MDDRRDKRGVERKDGEILICLFRLFPCQMTRLPARLTHTHAHNIKTSKNARYFNTAGCGVEFIIIACIYICVCVYDPLSLLLCRGVSGLRVFII